MRASTYDRPQPCRLQLTMSKPIIIIGAAGFGREAADVIEAAGLEVSGIIDDSPTDINLERLQQRGIPHLGSLDAWVATSQDIAAYVVGIGDPAVRERIATVMDRAGHVALTVVHPSSTVGTNCTIGSGSVVCAGVQLSTNVTLGRHVHVNPNATIGHDSKLDNFVSVNPAAVLAGEVRIGTRTLLGSACNILQQVTVGSDVTVGASALVTKTVPSNVIVKGQPGRWS